MPAEPATEDLAWEEPRPSRPKRGQKSRKRVKAEPLPKSDAFEDDAESITETEAEVLPALEDEDADEALDGDEAGEVVLDVGSQSHVPTRSTGASVPARRSRDGSLDRFLREMGRYPVLSTEEERALTTEYWNTQSPTAARRLVVHNLRLVVKMAYRYQRAWANVLDLIQEGNIGLVEAVQRFDPHKGAKFSTYASFWIRAYILRYLLENSRTVRISRTRVGRKLFFQLSKERAKLRAQGIDPGAKLLAERLGVDQADLEEVAQRMDQPEVRLDAPVMTDEGGSGSTVLDGMAAEGASPEAQAFHNAFAAQVKEAMDSFGEGLSDPREKAAWRQHLMSDDPVSLTELGKQFGVTKQRMGQIVNGLRKRLKTHLVERLGPDVELGSKLD